MSAKVKRAELLRLQAAFSREADAFHDASLSILYLTQRDPTGRTFRSPNHLVVLWQYYGTVSSQDDMDLLMRNISTSNIALAGLRGCELGCYGVVEGPETVKFVRMAARAGALFSQEEAEAIVRRAQGDFLTNRRDSGKPIVISNRNAMAVWVDEVIHQLGHTHSGYFPETTIQLDPFAASLAALDSMLAAPSPTREATSGSRFDKRRFRVALSFSGDRREYVAAVAEALTRLTGEGDVFYDAYYDAELARPNLDVLLQGIYHDRSDLVVVFLSPEYSTRDWCGLEWRAVRDLIKRREDSAVMLMRFGEVELGGLFGIDGQLDLSSRSPTECADAIHRRLSTG